MIKRTMDRIVLVQACVRCWLAVQNYRKTLGKRTQSAVVLQSAYRGHKVRRQMVDDKAKPKEDTTIVEFQALCRGYLARKKYKELVDEKNKAATKIQAHFKGHKQRKSFQRRKEAMQKENEQNTEEVKEDAPVEEDKLAADSAQEDGAKEPENGEEKTAPSEAEPEAASPGSGEEQETKAATVIQSNFRGYKERKKLQEEGKLPTKGKKDTDSQTQENDSLPDPSEEEKPAEAGQEQEPTEATPDVPDVPDGEEERTEAVQDAESKQNDEAQAQTDVNNLESLTKHISSVSQDFLMLQQKLNQIIMAHQINPSSNGMFTRGQVMNSSLGTDQQPSAGTQQTRMSRRSTKPKTLSTPEDSTYYSLIHRSVQERARKQSTKKLLDADDQYYQSLNSNTSTGETSGDTEIPESKTPTSNTRKSSNQDRNSLLRMLSMENEDNPHDYRKLLRKTSQRGRLIEQS
ncbi:myosin-IIIa-like [Ictalurus furcatus]|uniref:myosin-IIIa-like n=1 Tax=Ictalurus furcatus TaxID=66913 RepID=UPI002350B7C0|nr:myosin-IIIa-like [Ictalurus furcatus]